MNAELWGVVNNAGIACSSEIEWCPISIFEKVLNIIAITEIKSEVNYNNILTIDVDA